jgi:hypothetical protein
VVAVIGAIEIVVGIDVQAVRAREQAFAETPDEIAVAVEHDHRMLAAIEDVDAVLAVDADGSDVGELPAVRQFCPVLHHAITVLARAEDVFHVVASLLRHRHCERSEAIHISTCCTMDCFAALAMTVVT